MPLYTYSCSSCHHEFDELVKYDKRDEIQKCKKCGSDSNRKIAVPFGTSVTLQPGKDTIYSPKEIDKVVGAAAEKKWEGYDERWKKRYEERRKARWGDQTPQIMDIPKNPDGTYKPVEHLGAPEEKEVRKEFSGALKEHREKRAEQGLGQFDGPGAIIEK